MNVRRLLVILAVLTAFGTVNAFCQTPDSQSPPSSVPQIRYELNWPAADPQWYEIVVDATGRATYRSQARTEQGDTPGDPYLQKFTMSAATKTRIFELAKSLGYFKENFDYKGSNRIAQTGTKTLSYESPEQKNSSVFNWSENKEVMELATVFQRISTTIESGRKLAFALRFDKMGIDGSIKLLDDMERGGRLAELQTIAPVLQKAVEDRSTMRMSRQKAQRLLDLASNGRP